MTTKYFIKKFRFIIDGDLVEIKGEGKGFLYKTKSSA